MIRRRRRRRVPHAQLSHVSTELRACATRYVIFIVFYFFLSLKCDEQRTRVQHTCMHICVYVYVHVSLDTCIQQNTCNHKWTLARIKEWTIGQVFCLRADNAPNCSAKGTICIMQRRQRPRHQPIWRHAMGGMLLAHTVQILIPFQKTPDFVAEALTWCSQLVGAVI